MDFCMCEETPHEVKCDCGELVQTKIVHNIDCPKFISSESMRILREENIKLVTHVRKMYNTMKLLNRQNKGLMRRIAKIKGVKRKLSFED